MPLLLLPFSPHNNSSLHGQLFLNCYPSNDGDCHKGETTTKKKKKKKRGEGAPRGKMGKEENGRDGTPNERVRRFSRSFKKTTAAASQRPVFGAPRDLNHKRPTLIPVWTPTSQNQPLWRQNRSPFRHPFRSCMSERSPSSPQKKRGGHRQVRRDRLTCWYLTSSPSPFPSFLCYTTERRGTQ